MTFVLLGVVYVSLWTISQAVLFLPNEGFPPAECPLGISQRCFSFPLRLYRKKNTPRPCLALIIQSSVTTAVCLILVLRRDQVGEQPKGV